MFEKSSFKTSEFNNIEKSSEIHKSSEMYENNSDDSGVDNEKSPSGLKKEIFQQHISSIKDDNKEDSHEQENRYIRSERVHYYHGQPKHYYLDQPKSSSLLIPVKVRYS